jgi:hypothetical protein
MIRFMLLYVFKGGFLDGREGFNYAVLQAFYEYMIGLKKAEHEREGRGDGELAASSDPR